MTHILVKMRSPCSIVFFFFLGVVCKIKLQNKFSLMQEVTSKGKLEHCQPNQVSRSSIDLLHPSFPTIFRGISLAPWRCQCLACWTRGTTGRVLTLGWSKCLPQPRPAVCAEPAALRCIFSAGYETLLLSSCFSTSHLPPPQLPSHPAVEISSLLCLPAPTTPPDPVGSPYPSLRGVWCGKGLVLEPPPFPCASLLSFVRGMD